MRGHIGKKIGKSRNSFEMNSGGAGAHGQFDSEPK